jgi:hypothetical protein
VEDGDVHRPQVSRHPLGGAGGLQYLPTAEYSSKPMFFRMADLPRALEVSRVYGPTGFLLLGGGIPRPVLSVERGSLQVNRQIPVALLQSCW